MNGSGEIGRFEVEFQPSPPADRNPSLTRDFTYMSGNLEMNADDIAGRWSDHFDASVRSETPRAKVILSACYLDELLYQLLAIALKPPTTKNDPLFNGATAPLGSSSAKIELAARMALISDENRRSLHFVRKIRNRFAHELMTCDFNDDQITAWTRELDTLNDVASPERRSGYSDGSLGDFEKSVSWLIYWLKYLILNIPSDCPCCGTEMEHRRQLKTVGPH
jgi:hypothetical protein